MEDSDPRTDAVESLETQQPPSDDRQKKLAAWLQFPRRVVFLLVAFGLANLLLVGLRGVAAATIPMTGEMAERIRSGDLVSFVTGEPVAEMVAERLPNTLTLVGAALVVAFVLALIATGIGVLVHWLETKTGPFGSILKGLGRVFAFGPAAMPASCLGTLIFFLLALSAMRFGWAPLIGMLDPGGPDTLGIRIRHLILPALTLGLFPALLAAQAVSRELTLPREGGIGRRLLAGLFKMLGTLLGQIGGLLSTAVLVEVVFAWPGMGRLLADVTLRGDYPALLGILAAYPILILAGRLLSELFHWLARLVQVPMPEPPESIPSPWRKTTRTVWTVVSLALLLAPILLAAGGLMVPPNLAYEISLEERMQSPSAQHLLGRDEMGRDMLAQLLWGTWTSLGGATFAAVILFLPVGVGGAVIGFLVSKRTWWAELVADLLLLPADALLFIPIIPAAIAFVMLGYGGRAAESIAALATAVVLLPRAVRLFPPLWGAAPEHRKALRIALAGSGVILLGSVFAALWIAASMDFLGLGIVPPTPSLGGMVRVSFMFLYQQNPTVFYAIAVLWLCSFALYTAADALVGFFRTKESLVHLNE